MSALTDASLRHSPALAAFLTAGALLLTSCGTQHDTTQLVPSQGSVPVSGNGDASATTAEGDKNITGAGLTPLGDADMAKKTMRPSEPSELVVTTMRTGSHEGFDRVVFEMKGKGKPGWYVDYSELPTQQASGNPIEYHGTTALTVNIDGTVYPFDLGLETPSLNRITPDKDGTVTDVISVGTFEGRSQFIVGLSKRVPYSVQILDEPTRLVIDFVP